MFCALLFKLNTPELQSACFSGCDNGTDMLLFLCTQSNKLKEKTKLEQ